ncbi:zeatin O-xylosyltransferase-like [Nymphaea colorata]|uniref:zeatin O-xylosyltransferase-like n=1 Tax=Nymphaea colorata TaxID=210225 RepID=UPI00129DE7B4|nr:zeatin O-xylosyltransferase-like [Nymphaea colorata]
MCRVRDPAVVVLMLPFPAQGHLTPLLHFSRLLALRRLPVVFISSSAHNRQAKLRLQGWNLASFPSISFHDLPLPPFPVPEPDPESVIKFPAHLQPIFDVSDMLRDPLDQLLGSLAASSRRVVIVHDPLMSYAAELGSRYANVEAFAFRCVSAFSSLSFQLNQRRDPKPAREGLHLVSPEGCFTKEFLEFVHRRHHAVPLTAGEIFNTFDEMEGEFMEKLTEMPRYENRKIWGIGPIFPIQLTKRSDPKPGLFNWLDMQPDRSVLYVSFGSNSSLSSAQVSELAAGLEQTGKRFLWVLRAADRGNIFKKGTRPEIHLPEGFEQRVRGSGLVVRGWAPQLEILSHGAVGGFLSHCGWNSCMESLSLGVPLATWPLHSDQPANAQLVTEVLKVGVVVRAWGGGAEEVVTAGKIEKAVRRLMADTPEAEAIRERSAKVRDAARGAWAPSGSSTAALDSFIRLVTRA